MASKATDTMREAVKRVSSGNDVLCIIIPKNKSDMVYVGTAFGRKILKYQNFNETIKEAVRLVSLTQGIPFKSIGDFAKLKKHEARGEINSSFRDHFGAKERSYERRSSPPEWWPKSLTIQPISGYTLNELRDLYKINQNQLQYCIFVM